MYYCAIPSGVFHAPGALGHSLTQSPFLSPCFDGGGPIATLKKTKKHKQNIFLFFRKCPAFSRSTKKSFNFRNTVYSSLFPMIVVRSPTCAILQLATSMTSLGWL
jgi:hypothetical protein